MSSTGHSYPGPPSSTTEIVTASIPAQPVNTASVMILSPSLIEGGWTFDAANNAVTHSGLPSHVAINAHVRQLLGSAAQRPSPVLILEASDSGPAGPYVTLTASATGYIRNASGHKRSSNSLFYRDVTPPAGRYYRLRNEADSIAGLVTSESGQLDLVATLY